jgi:hypothetical protein
MKYIIAHQQAGLTMGFFIFVKDWPIDSPEMQIHAKALISGLLVS